MIHILVNLAESGQGVVSGRETRVSKLRESTNRILEGLKVEFKDAQPYQDLEDVYHARSQQERFKTKEICEFCRVVKCDRS